MLKGWRIACRIGATLVAVMAFAGLDVTVALAQSASCSQLNAQLAQLNRNGDFRNSDQANDNIRDLQSTMQDAQSAYNSAGCMSAQRQGVPQTPECRSYARQYLSAQSQVKKLQQSVNNGNSVAQQREEILQEIARFGCNARPGLADDGSDNGNQRRRPRNFLEELFGGPSNRDNTDDYGDTYDGQEQVDDPYANQQTGNTIRTVCVRMSDGYYWPVSYSTVRDYIPQDAQTCQAACPNQQVNLYFYDNPGQEPEQMVDQQGQPYTALSTAFAYRKAFDLSNTCKAPEVAGQVTLDDLGNGQRRAMITYNGEKFPLPIRDPRRVEQATTLPAKYLAAVDIPLPRPRPNPNAEASVVPPTAEPVLSVKSRTVKVGDKVVRVVGPDTPYAPATTAAGTSG